MTRVGVIGVGSMGRNHARIYSEIPDVALVGLADTNREAVGVVGKRHNVPVFTDYRQLLDECVLDAVSVAVPTADHAVVVGDAIKAGLHVLVEKPIALTYEEARRMMFASHARDVVLAVGHIERCNPAVIEIKRRLEGGELGRVLHLEARRWGPYPRRISDVGVVLDLSTHDIDVFRYLTGAQIVDVSGTSVRCISESHEDLVCASMTLDSGAVCAVSTNWVMPTKVRQLTVIGEGGAAQLDYLLQDLYIHRNGLREGKASDWESLNVFKGVSEGETVKVAVDRREPLRVELEAFLCLVRGGTPDVALATAKDGLAALDVALRIVNAASRSRVCPV